MSRDRVFAILVLAISFVGVVLSFVQEPEPQVSAESPSKGGIVKALSSDNRDRILVLDIQGMITDSTKSSIFGSVGSTASAAKKELLKAEKDNHIKGILLRINSPGGTVGLSQEIYQSLMRLRKKKVIISSIGDVAASGGYYIASASDLIYANPGSLTGSIGVITQGLGYQGLYQKLGLQDRTFKAGKYKDIGNGARAMTPKERKLMQALLNDTYNQFVSDVYDGRYSEEYGEYRANLQPDDIAKKAEGIIYTGNQALDAGLVDQLGGYYDALKELQKIIKSSSNGKIKKDLPVVHSSGSDSFKDILGGIGGSSASLGSGIQSLIKNKVLCLIDGSLCNVSSANHSVNIPRQPVLVLAPEFI